MPSKIIMMRPKNQESRKFQRIKSQTIFKNQDQDSRFKNNQDQDSSKESRLKIEESREDSIKISIKRIFQNMFTKEFLLSGNQLPVYCNRLPVAKIVFKMLSTKFTTFQLISKYCNRLPNQCNQLPVIVYEQNQKL